MGQSGLDSLQFLVHLRNHHCRPPRSGLLGTKNIPIDVVAHIENRVSPKSRKALKILYVPLLIDPPPLQTLDLHILGFSLFCESLKGGV